MPATQMEPSALVSLNLFAPPLHLASLFPEALLQSATLAARSDNDMAPCLARAARRLGSGGIRQVMRCENGLSHMHPCPGTSNAGAGSIPTCAVFSCLQGP